MSICPRLHYKLTQKANIHAFLESDDRIAQVLGHIDEALLELDEIDAQITGYRMQLNVSSHYPLMRKADTIRRSLTISPSSNPRTAVCRSRPPTRKRCSTSSGSYFK